MKKIVILIFLCSNFFAVSQGNNNNNMKKADSLMEHKNYKEALKIYNEILNKQPNNPTALYNAAFCELVTENPEATIQHLKKFIKTNKYDSDAHNLMGLAFEKSEQIDSAFFYYSKAIKFDKNFYEAYFNRGRCYFMMQKLDSAKIDFSFAKKNKTINPELYHISGKLNNELNDFESALKDYKIYEKFNKNDREILKAIADICYKLTNYEQAIIYYTKILAMEPENVSVLNNRALCYLNLEDTDKAEEDREKISEIQRKYEIATNSIIFKTLVSQDKFFRINIPDNWRAFVSIAEDSNIVIFFNPEFENDVNKFTYLYGGRIVYYPKYFNSAEAKNIPEKIELRSIKQDEYQQKRQAERKATILNFQELLRKRYNPNDINAREMTKARFTSADNYEDMILYEYHIITTSGSLICLYMWLPESIVFTNESIINSIINSLQTTENVTDNNDN